MPKTSAEQQAKFKAAESAIDQIKEKYGANAIMKFGEAQGPPMLMRFRLAHYPSTSRSGWACRAGASSKSLDRKPAAKPLWLSILFLEVQKLGGIAAFIDAEHALDPDYARKIGVDVDNLLISQPDTGEQALEILETLVRSNAVDVVVVDSVAALVPKAEIEGEMGESHMGLQARLMSQALRKLTGIVSKTKTVVIFINQIRHKIGVFFGNPETTTGGNALKFYSSVRIEVRRSAQIKQGERIIGNRVKVKVVKTKSPRLSAPLNSISCTTRVFPFPAMRSIPWSSTALSTRAVTVTRLGKKNWASAAKKAKQYLRENPKLLEMIRKQVWEAVERGEAPEEETGEAGEGRAG